MGIRSEMTQTGIYTSLDSGNFRGFIIWVLLLAVSLFTYSCAPKKKEPSVEEAEEFIAHAENLLAEMSIKGVRADWIRANFITEDTDALAVQIEREHLETAARLAKNARSFDGIALPPELARKFQILKLSLFSLSNPNDREEIARLSSELEEGYGKGAACPDAGKVKGGCLNSEEVERLFVSSRNPEELRETWKAWHAVGTPLRERYARYIQLQNKGARELGFRDMGDMWRARYDMPPDQFSDEMERLWNQVRPLYESLHSYVRSKLIKQYGNQAVTRDGLIRADLLGDLWAQEWSGIYPLIAPPDTGNEYNLTLILRQKKIDARDMARYGEKFFTSLGFAPLPKSFWERSLFEKPRDREVDCNASAWNLDNMDDLRLKMCVQIDAEDFITIHHELGHNFYQRAYNKQPFLFQDGANDGFHEAIGDTIALSITPEYLKRIGLIPSAAQSDDIARLLRQALEKIAFLPFSLVADKWRWEVMEGVIDSDHFNRGWWELREKYQGIAPPVARTEDDFDPGAQYYIPTNVPYARYFLAHILQFQFYRAMSREAGCQGPLHRCSFYDNKQAGAKLNAMLEMGRSRPWTEALETLTGESGMDASALLEYFDPLKKWLDAQNAASGITPGWSPPQDILTPQYLQ